MVEADISNSQPLIFCTYLTQRFGGDMPPNVREFIEKCEKGTFYDTVRRLVLTPAQHLLLGEQDFKTLFFAKIFYSPQKREWVWRKKFAARYPDVSEHITEMKQAGYKDLPRALSRKESEILLHGVAAKLLEAGAAFVTLHDAIYATAEWLPLVQQLIREEFARHGVGVNIKKSKPQSVPASAPATTMEQKLAQLEANSAATEAALEAPEIYELLEAGPPNTVSNDDFFAN